MPRTVRQLLVAVVLTAAIVIGGLVVFDGDDGGEPADDHPVAHPFTTTPLSTYDTSTVHIARAAFCDRVDARQVTAALGGQPPSKGRSWANGDRAPIGHGAHDVVHEFGCEYDATDGTSARAWVFAPPVTATRAQQLVASAEKAKGCTAAEQPPFGQPSVGLTCTSASGATASFRGLFGDAWLTCEVDLPAAAATDPAELTDRAGRWCVGVARAAAGDTPVPTP